MELEDIFVSVYLQYLPLFLKIAYKICPEFKEDIVQQAMLSTFKSLHTLKNRNPHSMRKWICVAVHNAALSHLRNKHNSKKFETLESISNLVFKEEDVTAPIFASEVITRAKNRLLPHQYEAMMNSLTGKPFIKSNRSNAIKTIKHTLVKHHAV